MDDLRHTVLLADDHTLVRQTIGRLIESTNDMKVVYEASNGAEALQSALSSDADLAVLDVIMPQMTGLQVASELKRRKSPVKVLILSAARNELYALEALRRGAVGYVHKSMSATRFLASCRKALRGELVLYPEDLERLISQIVAGWETGGCDKNLLTAREEQIVKLIAEGHSGCEIARMLFISPRTVERHRANILEKLDMPNRVALTRFAIRTGLIEP